MARRKGSRNGVYNLIPVTCAVCGGGKLVKPSELANNKTGRFFCGRLCWGRWLTRHHPVPARKVATACAVCAKPMQVWPSRLKMYRQVVCSNECRRQFRREQMTGDKNPLWVGGLQSAQCEQCGAVMLRARSRVNAYEKQFCSMACRGRWNSDHYAGEGNPNWRGGLSFEPYPPSFNEALREQIRTRDGRLCLVCGTTEEANGQKLSVHHVDYDKDNCTPGNLISLCHGCHSKTNFDRRKWAAKLKRLVQGAVLT